MNRVWIRGIYETHKSILLLLLLTTSILSLTPFLEASTTEVREIPPLSSIATHSKFALVNNLGYTPPTIHAPEQQQEVGVRGSRVNEDMNRRPQNEPSVVVNPNTGTVVVGANDYGIGGPIGGGVYTSIKGAPVPGQTYFPPFPLLCGVLAPVPTPACPLGSIIEPPVGTGDPVVVYSVKFDEFYYSSLGFSASFCENGLFLFRSSNGLDWTRPIVPNLAPPSGQRTIVYHDEALNCDTFHDKEWMVVDNNPSSSFFGRIYVTWTLFKTDPSGSVFTSSPIVLAYSDDRGETFSSPVEVSGSNPALCDPLSFLNQDPTKCDVNQFSVPVVADDSSVYIGFENFENPDPQGRNQYLVTRFNPATSTLTGPFQAAFPIYDRDSDFPDQTTGGQGRNTLCNSNFRIIAPGNLAIDLDGDSNAANDVLYVTWADNRAHQGSFSNTETVGPRAQGYPCAPGKATDADVFIVKSSNGGAAWTQAIQVNRDKAVGGVNDRDQWFPWVAVNSRNGEVAVVYHDRRYDTTPVPNKLARTTLSTSFNLNSWKETEAAGFASNFDDAFFGTGAFIGDYNNVAIASNGKIYAVFTGVIPGKMDSDIFIFIRGST